MSRRLEKIEYLSCHINIVAAKHKTHKLAVCLLLKKHTAEYFSGMPDDAGKLPCESLGPHGICILNCMRLI